MFDHGRFSGRQVYHEEESGTEAAQLRWPLHDSAEAAGAGLVGGLSDAGRSRPPHGALALLGLGVESDTGQTTLPQNLLCSATAKCSGDKMQDLEKMAAKLLETARKLPPGAEQHALLEQIRTFRIKLSAVAAKREELQSASQAGP
jgi:hypothetical protein